MNLTPEQIVNIIDSCKGHVRSLKITGKGIEVDFIAPHQPVIDTPSTHNLGQNNVTVPVDIPDEKNLNKDLPVGKTAEQVEDENLVDELHLTNPSAYEDLVVLKEITNVKED